jgi:hypothetical protein
MHDPRSTKRLSQRDIQALTFIGEGYEVAQYQLHAAVFPTVSAFVVSRFVKRAVANGWIAVERWNRVGINRLRLAKRGFERLIAEGVDPMSLFVPRKPVATKDVAHTLRINDLRVVLGSQSVGFDAILPAWQLQRRLSPAPPAIPDVLAIRKPAQGGSGFVCACEVDLGGERLTNVFLPKLAKLIHLVGEWKGASQATIVVLTVGRRRVKDLRAYLRPMADFRLDILVEELPDVSGAAAFTGLQNCFEYVESGCSVRAATAREPNPLNGVVTLHSN